MGNRSNISLVGNTTTGQNLCCGTGSIFAGKNTGNNLQFKSLSAGTGIVMSSQANTVTICSTGGGSITGGANGLSTSGDKIVLGGPLTGNTIITDNGTHNLYFGCAANCICGLYAYTTEMQLLGGILGSCAGGFQVDNSCATMSFYSVSGCQPGITLSATGTSMSNLSSKTSETCVVYIAPSGKLSYGTITGGGTITGATNGLSVSGKNIKLGGTLTGYTIINGGQTFDINQNILNLSGNTCVNITGPVKLITTPANGASSSTGLVWDTGTTQIKGVPVINEWVSSTSELLYAGQKFAYPTQTIMQTDVSTCVTVPNYIFIKNINLKTVGDTLIFSIPSGKVAFLNRAKLVILNDASPTCFSVSIGNNCCIPDPSLSMNNLANLQQISDVLTNETYELNLTTRHQGVPYCCGVDVFFRVGCCSTSGNNLCAHLLVEGFLY